MTIGVLMQLLALSRDSLGSYVCYSLGFGLVLENGSDLQGMQPMQKRRDAARSSYFETNECRKTYREKKCREHLSETRKNPRNLCIHTCRR